MKTKLHLNDNKVKQALLNDKAMVSDGYHNKMWCVECRMYFMDQNGCMKRVMKLSKISLQNSIENSI